MSVNSKQKENKIDKQRFKVHTYTIIFVNNNYAVYECFLGESNEW